MQPEIAARKLCAVTLESAAHSQGLLHLGRYLDSVDWYFIVRLRTSIVNDPEHLIKTLAIRRAIYNAITVTSMTSDNFVGREVSAFLDADFNGL